MPATPAPPVAPPAPAPVFTGIIQILGTVAGRSDHTLTIDAPGLGDQPFGASIAVNGTCLTIARRDGDTVGFDLLPETLSHTNLGALEPGARVNLEPALRAGDLLGGHWVQGHVDAVGTVRSTTELDGGLDIWLDIPSEILRYCIDRGSLTVNGTSLTVMELGEQGLRIQLIPETRERTNLGGLAPGDTVNLEADVLARYVERLLGPRATTPGA